VNFTFDRPWAAYSRVIAIAASTSADVRAPYSNFGPGIDLCAPSSDGAPGGDDIVTCTLLNTGDLRGHTGGGKDYTSSFRGTSAATPMAAGVAALMLSIKPNLTAVEVRGIMAVEAEKIDFAHANADPTGQYVDTDSDGIRDRSQWYGYGRIDAKRSVRGAQIFS
jgi:subtilisin family serine protease